MNDFDGFLEFELRQMLDPVVASGTPRRRGVPEATTGSNICRSSNSRKPSKSFICIRNASHNGSTHEPQGSFLRQKEPAATKPRKWLRGASAALRGGIDCRPGLKPLAAVEDLEVVLALAHLVRELDHLKTQAPWAKATRRKHHERFDKHPSTCAVQGCARNHRNKTTPSRRGVLAAQNSVFSGDNRDGSAPEQ